MTPLWTPMDVPLFILAISSPLLAPFLWWEIRDELRRRACDRVWDALRERDRLECEAAKRRREGAE